MPQSSQSASGQDEEAAANGSSLDIRELDQFSILDQTSDAIIITDLDGTIVFWNKQAEKLVRMKKEEALGKSIFDAFIPQVDMSIGMEIIESFNQKGEWCGEIPIQSTDGHHLTVSVSSTLLKDKKGEPIAIIGLGRDVTERKRIERELEEKAEVIIDPLPTVCADKMQMKQLLTNLVSNAIKFRGSSKPRIEVSAVTFGNDYVISVKDNGIGIDAKHADKLFKMFSRLHTREEYPGTGIGLAISKRIVERHGGHIWFESEVGKGTTFYFALPSREC